VEEEVLGKAYDGRLMRRLLTYMKPYRGTVAISLGFLLANSVVQILGPLLTKMAVDRYLVPTGKVANNVFTRFPPSIWPRSSPVSRATLGSNI
jgi:ATP-binding cassette, subfamily B, multidrug efflux pump